MRNTYYIDPDNVKSEEDKITIELTDILKKTTSDYINTIKKKGEAFTHDQFTGVHNALLNYFHNTTLSLIDCIESKEDQLGFIKLVDKAFHAILSMWLKEIGEKPTKH